MKDNWLEEGFEFADIQVIDTLVSTLICERPIELEGVHLREVRRLGTGGHKTAIITNNQQITTAQIAGYMFSRWSEEKFFRYMSLDYDIDHIVAFGTEAIDEEKK